VYDFFRFLRGSGIVDVRQNKETMEGHILRISHALEKGMALPEPRIGYGVSKASELIDFLTDYHQLYGSGRVFEIGVESIEALIEFHKDQSAPNDELISKYAGFTSSCDYKHHVGERKAGKRLVRKSDIESVLPVDPEGFFMSRSSVRQYSEEPVSMSLIERAVLIANKTPSVCNRQSCRVRIYTGRQAVKDVLSYQDGNKGFGESASAVLVVSSDMGAFYKSGERYQGYVDGGLFAMSLVYAFHSLGIGTCMLNWSQGYRSDKRFRDAAGIPDNELVVVMIAVGNIKDEYWVSESPRKDLGSIMSVKESM
jgi:nitroreductase